MPVNGVNLTFINNLISARRMIASAEDNQVNPITSDWPQLRQQVTFNSNMLIAIDSRHSAQPFRRQFIHPAGHIIKGISH